MEAFGTGYERLEIHAALAKVATSVESDPTDAAWVLRVGGSKRGLDVAARWEDELLLVDAPFPSLGESDWSYLEATGRFAGGAKLTRPTGASSLRLRAELPLPSRRSLGPALHALRRGLLDAHSYGQSGVLPAPTLPASSEVDASPSEVLAGLCGEAGWSFEPRQQGGVVELEVGERFEQARLESLAGGGLMVTAELACCPAGEEPLASAQAHCLMRAAGFFRLVRAAAMRREDGGWQPRYEICLPAGAKAGELHEALSALSVACLYSAEELRVLATEPAVAAAYLARARRA
jgi:hypothetical protein